MSPEELVTSIIGTLSILVSNLFEFEEPQATTLFLLSVDMSTLTSSVVPSAPPKKRGKPLSPQAAASAPRRIPLGK